jgi:hypothetical protein
VLAFDHRGDCVLNLSTFERARRRGLGFQGLGRILEYVPGKRPQKARRAGESSGAP